MRERSRARSETSRALVRHRRRPATPPPRRPRARPSSPHAPRLAHQLAPHAPEVPGSAALSFLFDHLRLSANNRGSPIATSLPLAHESGGAAVGLSDYGRLSGCMGRNSRPVTVALRMHTAPASVVEPCGSIM